MGVKYVFIHEQMSIHWHECKIKETFSLGQIAMWMSKIGIFKTAIAVAMAWIRLQLQEEMWKFS
jgi:hypothetical protein